MSDDKNKQIPIEQKTVTFYDDELIAVRLPNGQIHVSIAQMCRALGLDTQGQRQRIGRHTILADGLGVCNLHTPEGGTQTANTLRVDLIPLWLSGIRTKSIDDDATRDKLERFQKESARVLWEAFQRGELTAEPTPTENQTPAERALAMAKAVYELAQNQVKIERRLDSTEQRIEALEASVGNQNTITDEQAQTVSEGVKLIAGILSERSGRNEYGGVYGELYRRFGVTSYKLLPSAKYDEAIGFLRQWYQQLTDDDTVPF